MLLTNGFQRKICGYEVDDDRLTVNFPALAPGGPSWNEVQQFLERLNEREGVTHYRLPTEAQWEYACRAGSTTMYCFGDDGRQLDAYAWYARNAQETTHPVGQLKPNIWGLYDMHGNVWEWVQDRYVKDYYSHSPAHDPQGPTAGADHVLRGGCWDSFGRDTHAAQRHAYAPGDRSQYFGFRCACSGRRR